MSLDRRQFLRGTAALGAAATLEIFPTGAEGQEGKFRYFPSDLSSEKLEQQKRAAIRSLERSIPEEPEANNLRAYIPYLPQESQMYLPDVSELQKMLDKSRKTVEDLATATPSGSHGILIFADVVNGKRIQRMYVLRRDKNEVRFVKAYKISVAEKGFGNEPDSGQTPIDELKVHSKTIGKFGEVVSQLKKYADDERLFRRINDHVFVNSFGRESGNEIAEVVTDQYLLQGPQTPLRRAIRVHATNRSGGIDRSTGAWESYLDGKSLSGACIRMSNVDIRDLGLSGYIGIGTQVRVHATPEAIEEAAARARKKPRFWTPPKQ